MKHKWLSYLKPALSLTIISAVVTAALAGVHGLTKDVIAARTKASADAARRQVITADSFLEKTLVLSDETVVYQEAYYENSAVGYVFTTITSGKSAGLTIMTGLSLDGTITGISILEDNETAGYVDKVLKDGLLERICQAGTPAVDGTSNATRTSRGIQAGVEKALTYYACLAEGGTVS